MKNIYKYLDLSFVIITILLSLEITKSQKTLAHETASGTAEIIEQYLISQTVSAVQERYECVNNGNSLSTIVNTSNGRIQIFVWKSTFFGPKWTPKRRCGVVTDRFQRLADLGQLNTVNVGIMNGQNVVCATTSDGVCLPNGLLFTLEPHENPDEVYQQFLLTDEKPLHRSWKIRKPINYRKLLKERQPLPGSSMPSRTNSKGTQTLPWRK